MPIGPDVGVLLVRNAEEAGQFKIEDAGLPEGTNWTDMAAAITSSANIVVQVANGLSHAAGLVRLTEPTRAAMAAGAQPMKVNSVFGGVLLKNGNIAQHVQWLPATGAQALTVLSSLGPAASLFAITLQLSALKTRLEKIDGKLDQLIKALENKHMSTLKSAATKIAEAIEYVNESGILPEDSRAQLREVELSVSCAFDFFTDKLNETPALNQDTDEHENQKILNHTKAAQLAADMRFRIKWLLACQQRDENRRNAELSLKIAFDQHFKDSDTLKERGTRIYRSALRNELLQPSFLKRTGDAIGEFADTFATSFRGKKNEEKPFSLSEGLEQLLPQLRFSLVAY